MLRATELNLAVHAVGHAPPQHTVSLGSLSVSLLSVSQCALHLAGHIADGGGLTSEVRQTDHWEGAEGAVQWAGGKLSSLPVF